MSLALEKYIQVSMAEELIPRPHWSKNIIDHSGAPSKVEEIGR
jgi:hypothetical protein